MEENLDYIVNAFTKTENNVNLEVDNLSVGCITSKNNNFELDSEGNLTVKTFKIGGLEQNLLNLVYPVGSIYMSVGSSSPSLLFGGTWEKIQDKFLLASGSTYIAGTTGGEATHSLTIDEMPFHNHMESKRLWANANAANVRYCALDQMGGLWFNSADQGVDDLYTDHSGAGQAHNNMPPYLTVNVWKRTA